MTDQETPKDEWRTRRTAVARRVNSWLEGSEIVSVLESQGVPATLQTYQDRAFDGIFNAQRGWGVVRVFEEDKDRAGEIIEEYLAAVERGEIERPDESDSSDPSDRSDP